MNVSSLNIKVFTLALPMLFGASIPAHAQAEKTAAEDAVTEFTLCAKELEKAGWKSWSHNPESKDSFARFSPDGETILSFNAKFTKTMDGIEYSFSAEYQDLGRQQNSRLSVRADYVTTIEAQRAGDPVFKDALKAYTDIDTSCRSDADCIHTNASKLGFMLNGGDPTTFFYRFKNMGYHVQTGEERGLVRVMIGYAFNEMAPSPSAMEALRYEPALGNVIEKSKRLAHCTGRLTAAIAKGF